MKILEKIQIARDMHAKLAGDLLTDPALMLGLETLLRESALSRAVSVDCGISEICRRCDEEEGGSCCGAGIENRYTPELLLLNLLLGVDVPETRQFEKSCQFLGERGCLLAARDIICINYLCARLRNAISENSLNLLQEINGREMTAVFVLHDMVRKRCRG